MRSAHSEELSLLARERDAATARLEGAEGEAELLKEKIREAEQENEVCERVGKGRMGRKWVKYMLNISKCGRGRARMRTYCTLHSTLQKMRSQMSVLGTRVGDLQSMMSEKDAALARLQSEFGPTMVMSLNSALKFEMTMVNGKAFCFRLHGVLTPPIRPTFPSTLIN